MDDIKTVDDAIKYLSKLFGTDKMPKNLSAYQWDSAFSWSEPENIVDGAGGCKDCKLAPMGDWCIDCIKYEPPRN